MVETRWSETVVFDDVALVGTSWANSRTTTLDYVARSTHEVVDHRLCTSMSRVRPRAAPAPAPADGRKQAENADDTDDDAPPPASRPIKKEKRKTAHGYDCTDGFCVDGDEDEPARGARTSTEDIFGEPDSDEGDQDDAAEQPAKRRKESPPGWARVSL